VDLFAAVRPQVAPQTAPSTTGGTRADAWNNGKSFMLEFEDENRELLADRFSKHLDCVRDLLELGQRLALTLKGRLAEREPEVEPRTAVVVLLLLAQLLRRCRAAVVVWEAGYAKESETLTRSLFESQLAARFVIEPRLPEQTWSKVLNDEYKFLSNLSGSGISKFTDMNFRAMLYAASVVVTLDKKTERIKSLPGLRGVLPTDFGENMRESAADAQAVIGDAWADRIRSKRNFHGFSSVKLFAEYCGAEKSHYYETVYGLQSTSAHGAGATSLLEAPNQDQLSRSLCLPCGILGEALGDFDRVFSLAFGNELQDHANRIGRVFGTGG
jgi:hypothetical protein